MYVGKQDSAVLRSHDKRIERLERKGPFGPWMTWEDYLTGWGDDFVGKALHPQYTSTVNASGTVTLRDAAHGGWVRLYAPNAAGAYARLWLGDAAAGYSTACITSEWLVAIRMRVSTANVAQAVFGAYEAGTNNLYYGGHVPSLSANWLLWSRDNAGAASSTASAIAVDTDWHTLVFRSRITFLELWLDGSLICTHNTNLPTGCMEPFFQALRETDGVYFYIDWIKIVWR